MVDVSVIIRMQCLVMMSAKSRLYAELTVVLCGSGFSSIGSVSVQFWIKTTVSVSISKPSQHYF